MNDVMSRRRSFSLLAAVRQKLPCRQTPDHKRRRQKREQCSRENGGIALALVHEPKQVDAALLSPAVGVAATAAAAIVEVATQLDVLVFPRPPAIGARAERPYQPLGRCTVS